MGVVFEEDFVGGGIDDDVVFMDVGGVGGGFVFCLGKKGDWCGEEDVE